MTIIHSKHQYKSHNHSLGNCLSNGNNMRGVTSNGVSTLTMAETIRPFLHTVFRLQPVTVSMALNRFDFLAYRM